jgi:hypothetical protein
MQPNPFQIGQNPTYFNQLNSKQAKTKFNFYSYIFAFSIQGGAAISGQMFNHKVFDKIVFKAFNLTVEQFCQAY